MPPPLVITPPRLCRGFERLIEWAKEVRSLICCMDPNQEISCEGLPSGYLLDVGPTDTKPLIAVNCPPPITTPPTGTTTAGDLCRAMALLIAWAEDLKDIVCCIPPDLRIRVPADVLDRAKERKARLRRMKSPAVLHTVRCPAPETRTRTRRRQPKRKAR